MKLYNLKKSELVNFCTAIGIDTKGKSKEILLEEAEIFGAQEIEDAKKNGTDYEMLYSKIEELSDLYTKTLSIKIEERKKEMLEDDNSHYLIYRVLGISNKDGQLIDEYQNAGRFLYKYAGSFLEEAAILCFRFNNLKGKRTLIKNNISSKPKTFEIDFLDRNNAIEIKWKDATTDGDHISKEHTRVECITNHKYLPIRVMFYYPQRSSACKIQKVLAGYYKSVKGQYYAGDEAWNFVKNYTSYDLLKILTDIADKKEIK
ncbi:ApaLI family restriction endonuclease [Flavobacterium ajazii]|uniref:ApaLI family restriction endonuclease n=1 Tax=Flavobacterium ajazii TaxID=2692318 RepID=UPI0013D0A95B|nr:ApaLI family restriction endonuclease [Flavobacterium ajazii]